MDNKEQQCSDCEYKAYSYDDYIKLHKEFRKLEKENKKLKEPNSDKLELIENVESKDAEIKKLKDGIGGIETYCKEKIDEIQEDYKDQLGLNYVPEIEGTQYDNVLEFISTLKQELREGK